MQPGTSGFSGAPRSEIAGEARPLVSIVIPVLNERDSLKPLFSAIRTAISGIHARWEIVVVDDGSTDGTREIIAGELQEFGKWQVVLLARNFGQQAAYRAGLGVARGDALILMDADLQDPPEVIPQLFSQWQAGFKVVTACRTSRAERGLRRWCFDLFHAVFDLMTDQMMPRNSGMFSLIDRRVADLLIDAGEVNLFLPALKCWFGFPQTTVYYVRQERAVGTPKQSFRKLFAYALNGLLSFSELPLQWIGLAGILISVLSLGYAVVLVGIKIAQLFGILLSLEVKGFTTLAVAVFCLSGIQLICLGIIGQYLARIYREVKKRPLYIVEKIVTPDEPR